MWAMFLIAFGVAVVAGALLLGWGIPVLGILIVVLGAVAVLFAVRRAAAEPVTEGDTGREPTWATRHWWQ